jgi:hypothetical protein
MMPRRLVAIPSRPSMLPSSFTSVSQKITRFRSRERTADPHSSCGVLSDTIGCVHREVVARIQQAGFARVSLLQFLAVLGSDPYSSVFVRVGTLGTAGRRIGRTSLEPASIVADRRGIESVRSGSSCRSRSLR